MNIHFLYQPHSPMYVHWLQVLVTLCAYVDFDLPENLGIINVVRPLWSKYDELFWTCKYVTLQLLFLAPIEMM